MEVQLRKSVQNSFKLSGLSIRSDACTFLAETLSGVEPSDRDDWIEKIIDFIQGQTLDTPVVEKNLIETAILDACRSDYDRDEDPVVVISAFSIPSFDYCVERKKFMPKSNQRAALLGEASAKADALRRRYELLRQATRRNGLFSELGRGADLKSVESLIGSKRKLEGIILLGLLTQLEEGRYHLEDPTGALPLDLSNTDYHDGLFVDGSFVLIEGTYRDGEFEVEALGLPPREKAHLSRTYFGAHNYFGGPSQIPLFKEARLVKRLAECRDAMVVFVSDIWLDRPDVLDKLDVLFSGYSEDPPSAFILTGDFLSSHRGPNHYRSLREGFKQLADGLARYPSIINNSRFIVIAGPSDSPAANILPRPELPLSLFSDLSSVVKHLRLATNPCRLQFFTREIVVVREDLVTKLCRNTLRYPTSKDVGWHLARTLVCQTTLAPLSPAVCPIYWDFSSALDIYPTPDLVVVADRHKPFTTLYNDCHVVNPGSFSDGSYSFKVYYPSSGLVEDCQVPSATAS